MFSISVYSLVEKALVVVSIDMNLVPDVPYVSQPASISPLLCVKQNNVYTLICLSGIPSWQKLRKCPVVLQVLFLNVYMQIMIKSFLGRKDKSLLAFFGSLCGVATSMPV